MRGQGKRTWIKLYPVPCIEGSIRWQLGPHERGVWYDLLLFSALCSEPGTIADGDGRPYPRSFIANRLNITVELLDETLAKCITEGRIKENAGGLVITNWAAYQSEYQRQKPYREKKKAKLCFFCHKNEGTEIYRYPGSGGAEVSICADCNERGGV